MVLLAASLVPLAHPRNLASLKEKFTLIIFSLFHLNWPRIGFCNSIYKNELVFLLPKLTFQHHLHKIHMAFYLLTWTYFKDVIVGRNIINSRLERILFISSDKKKLNKTEKDRKNMEKEKKNDGSELVKMKYHIQILWSLLNLNEIQTSEILTVVAVIMRKNVQKQSSGGVMQVVL